ncbi:acyl-CoA dehydrogenase family protein [Paracoccus aminophilus]|uniref:Acyl-CoA dehydrogenase n=1 Tax=Paracoccus aminophilus JCM 7686 TaxID=1367847 RepID=S5YVW6_PARAH|nr:acyl-CoA dehydrogenase family protein [Paracoccus aminophilus]AGT09391.1 acyl-CoA dehydrogenase [Paracoccus aminophilus JCM 7686]
MQEAPARPEPQAEGYATHEVTNQPGDLIGYNAYAQDPALCAAMRAFGGDWAEDRLRDLGETVGSARMVALAREANRQTPELLSHDRFGNRIDQIAFHPAWHELMAIARGSGAHSLAWSADRPGAQVARAGLSYLLNQGENGVCCPITMTFASRAALSQAPALWAELGPGILSEDYDPSPRPAAQKTALSVAMAMTEKQGGSDLRQITTQARPGGGDLWLLTGHKWFFSVPQSDLVLTLAQAPKGVTCFLARGWLADGRRNHFLLQQLKDKCGNRSNASAEVEFRDLEAEMVGEEGRGIATILGMAHLTRLDCAISSGAIMRQALRQAIHHASHRQAFQRRLIDQPLMANVLTDLALDAEAFLWSGLRMAQTQDGGEAEHLLGRLVIPMGKYLACKRASAFVAEALECHGGNGYVETHLMARLYREAPLNGVWEGSGNVICLDVLRSIAQRPESLTLWRDEVALARGQSRVFDAALEDLTARLRDAQGIESRARQLVEHMARLFQASLLLRHAPNDMADLFCRARLGGEAGQDYGTLPDLTHSRAILARAAVGEI